MASRRILFTKLVFHRLDNRNKTNVDLVTPNIHMSTKSRFFSASIKADLVIAYVARRDPSQMGGFLTTCARLSVLHYSIPDSFCTALFRTFVLILLILLQNKKSPHRYEYRDYYSVMIKIYLLTYVIRSMITVYLFQTSI